MSHKLSRSLADAAALGYYDTMDNMVAPHDGSHTSATGVNSSDPVALVSTNSTAHNSDNSVVSSVTADLTSWTSFFVLT